MSDTLEHHGDVEADEDEDFSEETSDEDDIEFGAHDLRKRFRSATSAMEQNQGEFQKPEVLYDFVYKFRDIAGLATEDTNDTLLHIAIELVRNKPDVRSANMKPLIQSLLKDYPHLLKIPNNRHQTPLYMAIWSRKWMLVESMIEGCSTYPKWKSALEEALEIPCIEEQKKTCLHIAFERDLRAKVIEKLIGFAGDRAFTVQDATGMTPLHYAVEYKQCTDARIQLIDLFIERDGRVFGTLTETFLDLVDMRGNSVYQQHMRTLTAFVQQSKKSWLSSPKAKPRTNRPDTELKSLKEDGTTRRDNPLDQKEYKSDKTNELRRSLDPKEQGSERPELLNSASPASMARRALHGEAIPNSKKALSPEPGDSEPEHKMHRGKKVLRSKADDQDTMARNSKFILHRLKVHYMRTRDANMAVSFLYGRNVDDVQISFKYHGLPLEIKDHVFETAFAAMKFDDVLQYVSFPAVKVIRTGRQALRIPCSGQGRRDMEFFFRWLNMKGVRHIINIHVEDLEAPAHSDESIVSCLETMIVDNLDWQRFDVDPLSISRLGSKVDSTNQLRDLTLYWSGNNAVLRAWSELEGLPSLPNLTKICLHVPGADEALDSGYWMESNLGEFRERLCKNVEQNKDDIAEQAVKSHSLGQWPARPHSHREMNIRIVRATGRGQNAREVDPAQGASTAKDTIAAHRWLDSVDEFARLLAEFWSKTRRNSIKEGVDQTLEVYDDVVIALIDDGVDVLAPEVSGNIVGGRSFDDGNPYYISESGHGTIMASMIMRVCPMAKLYPLRLKSNSTDGGKHIDVKSAVAAIEAAIDKNVTIISMSWTLPISGMSDRERMLMDTVLQRACDTKVLTFCSSFDQGRYDGTTYYPVASKAESFFLIGAAKDNGMAHDYIDSEKLDFLFPGAEVIERHDSDNPNHSRDNETKLGSMTGSSVPTALAAGLAATILYSFKAAALANIVQRSSSREMKNEPILSSHEKRLSDPRLMRNAFQSLGSTTDGRFIRLWETLEPTIQVLEDPSKSNQEKLDRMNTLCLRLFREEDAIPRQVDLSF